MKLTHVSLCAAALSAACSHAQPVPERAAPSIVADGCLEKAVALRHHVVDLELRLDPPTLHGSAAVTVRALRDTSRVALDAKRLKVARVTTPDGGNARFTVADDRLCVTLPSVLHAGEERTLDVIYEATTDKGTPTFSGGAVWAGYQASAWMPTLQDPAERATLTLMITTQPGVKVIGSGAATGTKPAESDRVTHAFSLTRPTPPFLYAFAAGRFDEAVMTIGNGQRLRSLGLPGADLSRVTGLTATMVDFLTSHTGAELPSLEYTQVFVPGDAAQEAAGFALLSASSIDDVKRDETEDWIFSHELAHQWFAWLIPCADFSDFWLNEGFATFFVAAMKEQRHGRAAYDREVALWRKRSAKVHTEGKDAPVSLSDPSSPPHAGPTEAQLQPRGVTYSRGALVLDRLRTELGDAVFWNGVRGYVRDRAGKDARTEDLRRAMETASGKDLKPFFDTWVYRPAPTLLTLLRQNRRETWPEAKRSSEEIAVRRAER